MQLPIPACTPDKAKTYQFLSFVFSNWLSVCLPPIYLHLPFSLVCLPCMYYRSTLISWASVFSQVLLQLHELTIISTHVPVNAHTFVWRFLLLLLLPPLSPLPPSLTHAHTPLYNHTSRAIALPLHKRGKMSVVIRLSPSVALRL